MPRERKYESPIEAMLGAALDSFNIPFLLQEPIGPFFADIYIVEHRLVIECDGMIHASQRDYDERRDAYMRQRGYQVLRFSGTEITRYPTRCVRVILDTIRGVSGHIAKIRAVERRDVEDDEEWCPEHNRWEGVGSDYWYECITQHTNVYEFDELKAEYYSD